MIIWRDCFLFLLFVRHLLQDLQIRYLLEKVVFVFFLKFKCCYYIIC